MRLHKLNISGHINFLDDEMFFQPSADILYDYYDDADGNED